MSYMGPRSLPSSLYWYALYIAIAAIVVFFGTPSSLGAVGTAADAMCNPVKMECSCGLFKDAKGNCTIPGNKFMCPCWDVTNGHTTMGKCTGPNKCKGETGDGKGLGMDQLMQALKGLMDALKGKDSGQPPSNPTGTGCTSYYPTNDPARAGAGGNGVPGQEGDSRGQGETTTTTSNSTSTASTTPKTPVQKDPCAYYSPDGSGYNGLIDTNSYTGANYNTSDLLNSLYGSLNGVFGGTTNTSGGTGDTGTKSNVSDGLINALNNANTNTQNDQGANIANLKNGTTSLRGDIQVDLSGVTIFAGQRNEQANTEVAGFYGARTFGGQPTTIVGRLCLSRPWASSFLSVVISPSFFDNLCLWRGYQVGATQQNTSATTNENAGGIGSARVVETGTGVSVGSGSAKKQTTVQVVEQQKTNQVITVPPRATSTGPYIAPRAEIWAVPIAVPIGSRTSIFWNTRGVESCLVKSPDGSFSETSLSGGASTVPITTATTFTISCIALDGESHVTNYVTVNIAI